MPDAAALRAMIIEAVRTALEPRPDVLSLFEAGSAAFDRVDEWSDVDLAIDVVDGAEDAVWTALEAALAALASIETRWIVEAGLFPAMPQRFYRLAGFPDTLVVDVSLRPTRSKDLLTEVELHGEPRTLFDK